MGLLIYHLGYQTEHIPTGFVSVAISGGFGENLANLTGLFYFVHFGGHACKSPGHAGAIPCQINHFWHFLGRPISDFAQILHVNSHP